MTVLLLLHQATATTSSFPRARTIQLATARQRAGVCGCECECLFAKRTSFHYPFHQPCTWRNQSEPEVCPASSSDEKTASPSASDSSDELPRGVGASIRAWTAPPVSRPKTKCMDHYTLSGPGPTRLILSYGECLLGHIVGSKGA